MPYQPLSYIHHLKVEHSQIQGYTLHSVYGSTVNLKHLGK